MEIWQTILLAFGGSATVFAILGWLSKSLVSQLLTKDIESFKAVLKAEAETASQQLRHELEKASLEHHVKFSKLHEKRAEVISTLYGLLVQAYSENASFVSPMEWAGEPNKKEKYISATNASAEFYKYFESHRIYLPEQLCGNIEEFIREMRKKVIGFGSYIKYDDATSPPHVIENKHTAWTAAWEYFEEKVPEAKSALENELRSILGASK